MIANRLTEVPIFDHFAERELNALSSITIEKDYDKGRSIIEQGSSSDGLYIVLNGLVQVSRQTETGSIIVLNQLEKGTIFGALSIIDKEVRGASCIALTKVEVAYLPITHFQELIEGKSALALHVQAAILRSIFAEIRQTNIQLSELSALEPYFPMSSV